MEEHDTRRIHCILSEILEEKKSLTGFLDAIFEFLSQKTDFYHIQRTNDDKQGFPPGIKEEILLSCMQKYENVNFLFPTPNEAPPAINEIEVETDDCIAVEHIELKDKSKSEGEKCEPRTKFSKCDYRNGNKFEKYCWSQTLNDVELFLLLPINVTSAKHVKLNLKSNFISIKCINPREEELLAGETWSKFKHNDVVWTIADGQLILSFDKTKQGWWDKLLLQEQSIDVKTLDTDRPVEEFPDETQKVIEKIQTQRMFGSEVEDSHINNVSLSKSEQLARLKQAWNAENSPFKGQPFDPASIQFS
ncbi:nudC domain-containing protein 3 [Haematobia irritans]|uniref:nudC domain-containing protein 3 n=1 Tax=Haematobia irritans TaxID=7368 RepID=UPI003F50A67B